MVSAKKPIIRKILAIDDDPHILRVIKNILDKDDIRTDTSAFPLEAMNMQLEQYDLMLIDIDMPKMNGVELAKSIQSKVNDYHLPKIVLMSGASDPALLKSALSLGIDAFIEKPFDAHNMECVVKKYLEPRLKESHIRIIPRYDLNKGGGFLFGREQDMQGKLSRWHKLFGGCLEQDDECIDDRLRIEIREELADELRKVEPFGVISEENVVTHYYTGYLKTMPRQWEFQDPEREGFIRDDQGKITKRILYLSEEGIFSGVRDGNVHPGTMIGIMDYKTIKMGASNHAFKISTKTKDYIARKTGLVIKDEGEVYFWQNHQRRHSHLEKPAELFSGRMLIKTSLIWHVVNNMSTPFCKKSQYETVQGLESEGVLDRILETDAIQKYLI